MKASAVLAPSVPLSRPRAVDYLGLTRPRISVMVMFTVLIGGVLGSRGGLQLVLLLHTVLGTLLVAVGASALNQFLERHSDARMHRTRSRPLPSGRLHPLEAAAFGVALGVGGILYLLFVLPYPWSAAVAAFTFLSYVFVYTPLKRLTTLNTLVGAVPGALPPLIGWTAVRGSLDLEGIGLFLIIFFWQVPHFLAIAWIYRDDYARAGFRMLPSQDRDGALTGRCMALYSLALIPASLVPALAGEAGLWYVAGAIFLGLGFFACTLSFVHTATLAHARRVLRASLLYLPAVLTLLLLTVLMQRG